LFSDEILQRLVVQREICDQAFQPAILMLELPQPAGLVDLEATVLGLPAVERLLADALPSAELGGLPARLGLFQDPDDLLFREPLPAHRGVLPAGILSQRLTIPVAEFSGSTSLRLNSWGDRQGQAEEAQRADFCPETRLRHMGAYPPHWAARRCYLRTLRCAVD